MSKQAAPLILSSISDVERDTGVAKETLRVWERRYDFPQPQRDANGERVYPPEQVHRLRLVRRLLDLGFRPGKIMHYSAEELADLTGKTAASMPAAHADHPQLGAYIELIKTHQIPALRQRLAQALLQTGIQRFVIELVAPLTTAVGDAWAKGELAVFEEHLYAELMQSVLRNAIAALTGRAPPSAAGPRIVLTTVPQERHGLGLLMAEALFALEGADCIPLGVQTPLAEIVDAARTQRADIVALSFSSAMSPRAAVENVTALRERLAGAAEVWSGGACAALARRHLDPACVFGLSDIAAAVARWRARRAAGAVAV